MIPRQDPRDEAEAEAEAEREATMIPEADKTQATANRWQWLLEPVGDDTETLHTRIRQRATSLHYQRAWRHLEPDEIAQRLTLHAMEWIDAHPEDLQKPYWHTLNRITWRANDTNKVDHYRTNNLHGPSLDEPASAQDPGGPTLRETLTDDPLTVVRDRTTNLDLSAALAALPQDQLRAFVLQNLAAYSQREIAAALHLDTTRQATYTLKKARTALREDPRLTHYAPTPPPHLDARIPINRCPLAPDLPTCPPLAACPTCPDRLTCLPCMPARRNCPALPACPACPDASLPPRDSRTAPDAHQRTTDATNPGPWTPAPLAPLPEDRNPEPDSLAMDTHGISARLWRDFPPEPERDTHDPRRWRSLDIGDAWTLETTHPHPHDEAEPDDPAMVQLCEWYDLATAAGMLQAAWPTLDDPLPASLRPPDQNLQTAALDPRADDDPNAATCPLPEDPPLDPELVSLCQWLDATGRL